MAIFSGFDGLNCKLDMSPRELKALFLALDQLQQKEHKAVADAMNLDGFTFTAGDVFSVLRALQLNIKGIAEGVKGERSEEIEKAKRDAASTKKDISVN